GVGIHALDEETVEVSFQSRRKQQLGRADQGRAAADGGAMGSEIQAPSRTMDALIVNPTRHESRERYSVLWSASTSTRSRRNRLSSSPRAVGNKNVTPPWSIM